MKTLLEICLLLALVLGPTHLMYWNLFRPVLIQRLKYRLFKCRDEMRIMLISDSVCKEGKAYLLIERFCNQAIRKIESIDLVELASGKVDKRTQLEVERDLEIILDSPLQLRSFFFQMSAAVLGAACANSPGILVVAAPLCVFAVTTLWFQKAKTVAIDWIKHAFGSFYLLRPA